MPSATIEAFERDHPRVAFDESCANGLSGDDLQPFAICLGWVQSSLGRFLAVSQSVFSPSATGVDGNLSALELVYDTAVAADSNREIPVQTVPRLFLKPGPHQNKGYRRAWDSQYLILPEADSLRGASVAALRGQLVLRLPENLARLSLDTTTLGNSVRHDDGITLTLIGFSDDGLDLAFRGPREQVVQFLPRDAEGQALDSQNETIEAVEGEEDLWRGSPEGLRSPGEPRPWFLRTPSRSRPTPSKSPLRPENNKPGLSGLLTSQLAGQPCDGLAAPFNQIMPGK